MTKPIDLDGHFTGGELTHAAAAAQKAVDFFNSKIPLMPDIPAMIRASPLPTSFRHAQPAPTITINVVIVSAEKST